MVGWGCQETARRWTREEQAWKKQLAEAQEQYMAERDRVSVKRCYIHTYVRPSSSDVPSFAPDVLYCCCTCVDMKSEIFWTPP